MELQHRLARQAIDIAVSKGMEDMKSNAKRSIRNLVDLGLYFSKSDNQKQFFSVAQKVITNSRNPYHLLATRMISNVDNTTIKKVGLNLGYTSLIYGANKLKKRQADLMFPVPWLLILDVLESGSGFFQQMAHCIKEGQDLGIYSYIICPHEKGDILPLCEIAKRFDECLFICKVSADLISEKTAEALGRIHNAIISVQVTSTDFAAAHSEILEKAFRLLKQNRCLCGFHVRYNDENMGQVTAPEYIRSAISLGNLFGLYIADNGVSQQCKDTVYAFVCKERGINGQPLIVLDWLQDMRYISEKILSGDGYMKVNLAEIAYGEYKKAKDALAGPLLETLRMLSSIRTCTTS